MDIALSLGAAGAPQPSLPAQSGLCFIYFFLKSEKRAEFYLQVWGSTLHQLSNFLNFCGENEGLMAAPSSGMELISGIFPLWTVNFFVATGVWFEAFSCATNWTKLFFFYLLLCYSLDFLPCMEGEGFLQLQN